MGTGTKNCKDDEAGALSFHGGRAERKTVWFVPVVGQRNETGRIEPSAAQEPNAWRKARRARMGEPELQD